MKTERIKLVGMCGIPHHGCAGFPSCTRHPSKLLGGLEQRKLREYHKWGGVSVRSPKYPSKDLLIFCMCNDPNNPTKHGGL